MAVLSNNNRREIWTELMSDWSRDRKAIPVTKDVLLECVNSVDQWFSDQTPSLLSSLPQKFREEMTNDQIADLVDKVYARRRNAKTR
jgi:hypothetical protein